MLQDSINHFVFDIENNGKTKEIKTSPIAYFMGILKRTGMYTAPDNYESPREKSLRIYYEQKKKELEKMQKIEKKLFETEYSIWSDSLTAKQKNEIIPDAVKKQKLMGPRTAAIRLYFEKNIWGNIKDNALLASTL